jgi:hypothetical protein
VKLTSEVSSKHKTSDRRQTIGGDFELQSVPLGMSEQDSFQTNGTLGMWTTSGRAALAVVLKHLINLGVTHINLPAYLCGSVLLPIKELDLTYSFYKVDDELASHPDPVEGSAVLLIHYFGWLNKSTARIREEAVSRPFYLIEDTTHALLSDWGMSVGNKNLVFMTPRKFGPVPLGGWCSVDTEVEDASKETEAMAWQSVAARLVRGLYLDKQFASSDLEIETFYLQALRAVELFLDHNPTDIGLPQIVFEIIAGLDWDDIAKRRRANWRCLHDLLDGHVDALFKNLPEDVVPLGYVISLQRRDRLRDKLASHRIFCPVHWTLPNEVDPQTFPEAALLSNTCMTIPIDQRYDTDDMVRIAEVIKTEL